MTARRRVQNGRHVSADGARTYVMTRWVGHAMYVATVRTQPGDQRCDVAQRVAKARHELRAICDRHRADIMTLERGERFPVI